MTEGIRTFPQPFPQLFGTSVYVEYFLQEPPLVSGERLSLEVYQGFRFRGGESRLQQQAYAILLAPELFGMYRFPEVRKPLLHLMQKPFPYL